MRVHVQGAVARHEGQDAVVIFDRGLKFLQVAAHIAPCFQQGPQLVARPAEVFPCLMTMGLIERMRQTDWMPEE